jgi:hypothetical protein
MWNFKAKFTTNPGDYLCNLSKNSLLGNSLRAAPCGPTLPNCQQKVSLGGHIISSWNDIALLLRWDCIMLRLQWWRIFSQPSDHLLQTSSTPTYVFVFIKKGTSMKNKQRFEGSLDDRLNAAYEEILSINNKRRSEGSLDDRLNAAYEKILDKNGEVDDALLDDFALNQSHREPERLISLYTQIKSQKAKNVFARWIGSFHKKKGLILLLDNLYSQQIIGNDNIRAILKKYPLFADVNLESSECDEIISVVLDFLDIPCPEINDFDDYLKFMDDLINREKAARILVVLNEYYNTSMKSIMMIQNKGDLIATYELFDAATANGIFAPIALNNYLSGRRR